MDPSASRLPSPHMARSFSISGESAGSIGPPHGLESRLGLPRGNALRASTVRCRHDISKDVGFGRYFLSGSLI